MKIIFKKILVPASIFLSCALSVSLADENRDQLLQEYNQQYDNYLVLKKEWAAEITQLNQNLELSRTEYEEILESSSGLRLSLQRANADLESKRQYLNFLKRLEPLSEQKKLQIKQTVVSSGEFSSTSAVNPESLESKAVSIDEEAKDLEIKIQIEINRIAEIKRTDQTFIRLDRELTAVNRNINDAQSRIDSSSLAVRSLNTQLGNLRNDLTESRDNEDEARKRLIEIRDRELPTARRDREVKNRELSQLRSDLDQAERRLVNIRRRINEVDAEILAKEQQIQNSEPLDRIQLEFELAELKLELRTLKQRRRNVRDSLEGRRGFRALADNAQSNLDIVVIQIQNLEELAIRKQDEAGNEAIMQISLARSIEATESELSAQNEVLTSAQSQLRNFQREQSSINSQITDFEIRNIRPIEDKIAGLRSGRNALVRRSEILRTNKVALVRQDNNIQQAKEMIPTQEGLVSEAEVSLSTAEAKYESVELNIEAAKSSLNQSINNKNELITSARKTVEDFKNIESRLLNLNKNEEVR